jgi:hypothetical protein
LPGGNISNCSLRILFPERRNHGRDGRATLRGRGPPSSSRSISDPDSYSIENWLYHTTEAYGSDDYRASDPQAKGHDTLNVKVATLSSDKKSISLETDAMKPVQQYMIKMRLRSADGATIKCGVAGTVNKLF